MPILAIRAANFRAQVADEIKSGNHSDEINEELNNIMALLDSPSERKLDEAVRRFFQCIGKQPNQ